MDQQTGSGQHNAFRKLAWCTERGSVVIRFYVALANTIIIVRRLVREAWTRYRWDTRHDWLPHGDGVSLKSA